MADAPLQLVLLQVPPSARGPARLPATRRSRPLPTATLELPGLSGPVPETEGLRWSRLQLALAAKTSRVAPEPPVEAPGLVVRPSGPGAAAASGVEAAPGEDDATVFAWPRRPSPARKESLLEELASRLGATRRSDGVELRASGRVLVTIRPVEAGLRVRFTEPGSRSAHLAAVREVTREHGLVEPE
jgi:hypothetical protein